MNQQNDGQHEAHDRANAAETRDAPKATVRTTGWRGWVWAVPIAALMLVAYLALRTWVLAGPTVTVVFPEAGGIGPEGTPVKHKGVQVGTVKKVRLTDDLNEVVVRIAIDGAASDYLREGAQFWIVQPGLGGGGIKSMLAGSYIAMSPGDGQPREQFEGGLWRPVTDGIEFDFVPPGGAEDLKPGDPVRLGGREVGRVRAVGLTVDVESGAVRTPVRIAVSPTGLGLGTVDADRVRSAMSSLVERGLRAQVQSTGLVLGGKSVALVMADDPPPAGLDLAAKPPRLPAIASSGIEAAIARATRFAEKLEALPMARIAGNVQSFTDRVDELAASPKVDQAIADLQQAAARIKSITDSAEGQIEPMLKRLRETSASAAEAADAIARLSGASPHEQEDIEALVAELIRTAASIRTLTDYLTRHPQAIIQGRPEE